MGVSAQAGGNDRIAINETAEVSLVASDASMMHASQPPNPKGTVNAMNTTGRRTQLPDIYPQDGSGTLRWSDGTIWVPVLKGSGLLGRITRRDRRHYVAAMESQLSALERAVNHHREQLGMAPGNLPETGPLT